MRDIRQDDPAPGGIRKLNLKSLDRISFAFVRKIAARNVFYAQVNPPPCSLKTPTFLLRKFGTQSSR